MEHFHTNEKKETQDPDCGEEDASVYCNIIHKVHLSSLLAVAAPLFTDILRSSAVELHSLNQNHPKYLQQGVE